jgi:hypothetical protein
MDTAHTIASAELDESAHHLGLPGPDPQTAAASVTRRVRHMQHGGGGGRSSSSSTLVLLACSLSLTQRHSEPFESAGPVRPLRIQMPK